MKVDVDHPVDTRQLFGELQDAGVENLTAVHYYPDDGYVEIHVDDPRVPSLVAGHAPDRRKMLPADRRELLELIEQEERGELPPERRKELDEALLGFVKKQILGG